jgi:hypothetical protein
MHQDQIIREQLLALLGGKAHIGFEDAVSDFPLKEINRKLPDGSYTAWHLLDHLRIAQWDIVEYVLNPNHVSPEFPSGYWPKPDETATTEKWKKTIEGIRTDLRRMEKLVTDPKTELLSPLPHDKDCTVYQQALLVADHNAYHIGELVIFKRLYSG